jgi:hypothetical protein
VLIVTARFVWLYLRATRELAASSVDQVEVQEKPAIIVCVARDRSVSLKNIGNGPAIDLELVPVTRDSVGSYRIGTLNDFVKDRSFVEPGEEIETFTIFTRGGCGGISLDALDEAQAAVADSNWGGFPASLQCQYRSLSGRIYWTVSDFTKDGCGVARSGFTQQELTSVSGAKGILGFFRKFF